MFWHDFGPAYGASESPQTFIDRSWKSKHQLEMTMCSGFSLGQGVLNLPYLPLAAFTRVSDWHVTVAGNQVSCTRSRSSHGFKDVRIHVDILLQHLQALKFTSSAMIDWTETCHESRIFYIMVESLSSNNFFNISLILPSSFQSASTKINVWNHRPIYRSDRWYVLHDLCMSSSKGKSVSDSLQMDRPDASIGTMVQYVQIMSVWQKSGETQALKSVLLMESLAPPTRDNCLAIGSWKKNRKATQIGDFLCVCDATFQNQWDTLLPTKYCFFNRDPGSW